MVRSDVISCSQLEDALAALKEISGDAKVKRIVAVLDTDSDGAIHLSEIAEVGTSISSPGLKKPFEKHKSTTSYVQCTQWDHTISVHHLRSISVAFLLFKF